MGEAGGGLSWLILWGQLVLFHRGGTILAAVVVKAVGGVVCEHKCSLQPGCKAVFTPGWVDGRALPKIINLDVESAGRSIGSQHGLDHDGCNLHDSAPHTVVFSQLFLVSYGLEKGFTCS